MLTADAVKHKARELGFDLCGIAPAEAFPELSFLREWLDRGYAGDMGYLARSADRRADVRAVVPGARSVIVTATVYNADRPYSTEVGSDPGLTPVALIARYAWGDDYHEVLKARLDALLAWMRETSPEPFAARAYVDTGPVQERVFAQYAGLGWIGKNTCLINPELGSWLFLSEIICTLPLEPDTQGLEQCGSCTRCLEACPTGALVEAGVLDSNRCLSYLTIELRTAIPEEHRPALGRHVYGCDICQEVCPYNQVPPRSDDAGWQPRPALDLPRLVDLWRRPDRELRAILKGSAMTRAKLTGLRRNLAVAIGNSGDAEAIAALAEESDERPSAEDDMVLDHIRWAVTRATI
ncbi:MAG TPA: tRNA epoxyqueuosine(34) reductase QueG [Vicinamibacterales bacterium]